MQDDEGAIHEISEATYLDDQWRLDTSFEMTVLSDLERFHLVMDTIDRLPQTGDNGIDLKQQVKDKLVQQKQYIDKHGADLPKIRNWKWEPTQTSALWADHTNLPQ